MHYDVQIAVSLKDGIPDMPGHSLMGALRNAGLADSAISVNTGKLIELGIDHDWRDDGDIDGIVESMCRRLLVHPVVETYTYRMKAHYIQPNGEKRILPISRWVKVEDPAAIPIEHLMFPIWRVDLTDQWPAIGPYRILRAEWYTPSSTIWMIRYSRDGEEQKLGWALDVGGKTFRDDIASEIGIGRARTLQKLAPEIVSYAIRYNAVYKPEPELHED